MNLDVPDSHPHVAKALAATVFDTTIALGNADVLAILSHLGQQSLANEVWRVRNTFLQRCNRDLKVIAKVGMEPFRPTLATSSTQATSSQAHIDAHNHRGKRPRLRCSESSLSTVPSCVVAFHSDVKPTVQMARKAERVVGQKIFFWNTFMDVGVTSSRCDAGKMSQDAYVSALKADFDEECDESAILSSHRATLEAFQRFSVTQQFSWSNPSPHDTKAFIRSFRVRGPTVPHTKLLSLGWSQELLGLEFHTDHRSARNEAEPPPEYEPHQAEAVAPELIAVLIRALASDNDFMFLLAVFWAVLIQTSLRPAHVQRSTFVVLTDRMEGHVSHGKRKIKGHQRPYYWSAGRQFLGGIDLGAKLLAAMRMTGLGHASARGLLPDFGPARVKFANLRTIQKSLMPHARISALSSAMFRAAGASPAQLRPICSTPRAPDTG